MGGTIHFTIGLQLLLGFVRPPCGLSLFLELWCYGQLDVGVTTILRRCRVLFVPPGVLQESQQSLRFGKGVDE